MDRYQDVRERVFELMNGFTEKKLKGENSITVRNEFEAGSKYDRLYEVIYEALLRLSSGSGTEEDMETVQGGYSEIIKRLSLQMYDYGYKEALIDRQSNYLKRKTL